ncbi:MAG: DUF362 domain-containing protein [Candidatus Pacebacteria bacterium]|nr:DUF362 domain-containing protein [Candidatus Paceibacterota bacterium]
MKSSFSRREFIKTGVVAGVGLSFPSIWIKGAYGALEPGHRIHPAIDERLVVGVTDAGMVEGHNPVTTWAQQEAMVKKDVVWANMDKLACRLSGERAAQKAWRTIFVKPPKKAASDIVVAIKTNNIAQQHTRSPVIAKVCHVLVNDLGVKAENIYIYDACHGGNLERSTPFSGLPEGVHIANKWGGFSQETAVPEPWTGGTSSCLKHLVDNTVDILVNVAMCKGHGGSFGRFTMTMKNHFGTFAPRPGHSKDGLEYLIALNRTPEILGPIDPKTGAVTFPRQQLCIVDALWASDRGPGGNPSHQPNFLAMGALSPVVDYQVGTQFRQKKMGWNVNVKAAERFLTDFGYTPADLPHGGELVEV